MNKRIKIDDCHEGCCYRTTCTKNLEKCCYLNKEKRCILKKEVIEYARK